MAPSGGENQTTEFPVWIGLALFCQHEDSTDFVLSVIEYKYTWVIHMTWYHRLENDMSNDYEGWLSWLLFSDCEIGVGLGQKV